MGLEMSDGPGHGYDKEFDKKKRGGKSGAVVDAFWQVLGVVLAVGLLYVVARSSEHARTVPVESHTISPDHTRIEHAVGSR
jgi:hypothetical protein